MRFNALKNSCFVVDFDVGCCGFLTFGVINATEPKLLSLVFEPILLTLKAELFLKQEP
jgi:hypothetical protein